MRWSGRRRCRASATCAAIFDRPAASSSASSSSLGTSSADPSPDQLLGGGRRGPWRHPKSIEDQASVLLGGDADGLGADGHVPDRHPRSLPGRPRHRRSRPRPCDRDAGSWIQCRLARVTGKWHSSARPCRRPASRERRTAQEETVLMGNGTRRDQPGVSGGPRRNPLGWATPESRRPPPPGDRPEPGGSGCVHPRAERSKSWWPDWPPCRWQHRPWRRPPSPTAVPAGMGVESITTTVRSRSGRSPPQGRAGAHPVGQGLAERRRRRPARQGRQILPGRFDRRRPGLHDPVGVR